MGSDYKKLLNKNKKKKFADPKNKRETGAER